MKIYSFQLYLYVCFALMVNSNIALAERPMGRAEMEQKFIQAKSFIESYNNDSANIILTHLIKTLSLINELDTPFGMKVLLSEAEALEKDHQDELAIEKLLYLAEVSKLHQQWGVHIHTHLSLARLYEKMQRWDSCLVDLRQAEATIKEFQVDSIYPRFFVRISSYHRIHGDIDSALYYANEVVRTAPLYNQNTENATGYLLLGLIHKVLSHEDKAINYFKISSTEWQKMGNYRDYGGIQYNLSRIYYHRKNYKIALLHNDSCLMSASKIIESGHNQTWLLHGGYQQRAKILYDLEQMDSAWFYLNEGYQIELEKIFDDNNEKVIEIDVRYKDEKKAQRIEEQSQQIKYEKERKNWLVGIISIVVLFALILVYYYIRLRTANQKTEAQAWVITQANTDLTLSLEQQIMLQGEIHHRVKNNLQVIISLLELQMENIEDSLAHKSLRTMSGRIHSMAAIHEILYQKEGTELVDFNAYIKNLCEHFSDFLEQEDRPSFKLNIETKYFNLETLMPLGIILTELLTNSLKYASNTAKQLAISIKMETQADGYVIRYKDNGPGFPQGELEEREGGLGTYLLKSMSRQLHGSLQSSNDRGAVSTIFFKEKNNLRS